MQLLLERFIHGTEETIGRLFIDGQQVCFTLEDQHRTQKVKGDTRIPAGTYVIKLRKEGTHHLQYAKKFPGMHLGMLHLQNVPNFQYILIHIGNTDKDTEGCILLGSAYHSKDGRHTITESTVAYNKVYPVVAAALQKGLPVTIEIKDL
jgi:hypothetical protein